MASVPEVGVLIARVFVGADLRISDSDTESVVNVGRALSVRLLALSKLVLRVVSVVRYSVRCDLSREIARLVVAVGRRAVGVRLRYEAVLEIVGIRALAVGEKIPRLVVGVLLRYSLNIRFNKLIRLVVVVAYKLIFALYPYSASVLAR